MKISRRNLIRGLFWAGLGASIGYTTLIEPNWLALKNVGLNIENLPKELDELKVGFLADFHMGDFFNEKDAASAVNLMNSQNPDVILLGGDFVEGDANNIFTLAPILKNLVAPLGIYAVLGNHDYWTNAETISKALQDNGVRMLINQSIPIEKNGVRFYITGLDDAWEGEPNIGQALARVPKDAFKLLLVHEPDYADALVKFDAWLPLQLSGHSHGGQVKVPFLGAPILPFLAQNYPEGLNTVFNSNRQIYTTKGVGGILPIRFNCRPDATLLTLKSAI